MKVLLVFPETPRAAFNTARGWWNALSHDPDVSEVHAVHTRGYYNLPEAFPLGELPKARGYDVAVVVWGYQVDQTLSPGAKIGAAKSALVLTDEPYETSATLAFSTGMNEGRYDIVASQDSSTVADHPCCIYLPTAWDPYLTPTIQVERGSEMFDLAWVGSADERRSAWLKTLDWQLRGASWLRIGAKQRPWMGDRWTTYYRRVRKGVTPGNGFFSPEQVLGFYNLCRVVFNIHRSPQGHRVAESPNPRLYECMSLGKPCFSDFRPNLPEGCLTFKTPVEMAAFARAYLAGSAPALKAVHESVEAGLAVAEEHTYGARWGRLREALNV